MKLLKHIEDKTIPEKGKYQTRFAARAIVMDENNRIPILFVSKFRYHKIPGGGIEKGENAREACEREMLEETGCKAKLIDEIGEITEYRSEFNLFQTSYCYFGKILSKGPQKLERSELDEGFQLVWLTLEEALSTLKKDKPRNYEGSFIQERDLTFLKELKARQV